MSWLDALPEEKKEIAGGKNAKRDQDRGEIGQEKSPKDIKDSGKGKKKVQKPGSKNGKNESGSGVSGTDRKRASQERKEKNRKSLEVPPIEGGIEELAMKAHEAKMQQEIYKAELAAYKVEKESMEVKKAAGDIMQTDFGEFLFFGYMERCNLDLLRLMKRIEPMIENMVNDKNTRGIVKRINSEITNILKGIQKQQAEDAKNWRREK